MSFRYSTAYLGGGIKVRIPSLAADSTEWHGPTQGAVYEFLGALFTRFARHAILILCKRSAPNAALRSIAILRATAGARNSHIFRCPRISTPQAVCAALACSRKSKPPKLPARAARKTHRTMTYFLIPVLNRRPRLFQRTKFRLAANIHINVLVRHR